VEEAANSTCGGGGKEASAESEVGRRVLKKLKARSLIKTATPPSGGSYLSSPDSQRYPTGLHSAGG